MKNCITSLILLCFSFQLSAQWDTLITNTNATFDAAAFYDSNHGTAVGYDPTTNIGKIFQTSDGQTWTENSISNAIPAMHAITFFDATNGLMAGDSGKVYITSNSGTTWTVSTTFTTENLTSISMPSITSVFVGGVDGGLYQSQDGGATWDTLNSGTTLAVRDLYFVYANTGWVIGDGGYMGITADGAQTWNYFPQPYFGFFQPRGICYAGTTNTAFCVGENGLAITSADAGMTWNTLLTPTAEDLNSVRFGNDLGGVMCGNNNFVSRSVNGGANWIVDTVPGIASDLRKICWASDSVAYIVGSNGRVLKNNMDISAINEISTMLISVNAFPNPFNDQLHISMQIENAADVRILVTDISGRILSEQNEGELSSGEKMICISGMNELSAGIYFVKVLADGTIVSVPVIKK